MKCSSNEKLDLNNIESIRNSFYSADDLLSVLSDLVAQGAEDYKFEFNFVDSNTAGLVESDMVQFVLPAISVIQSELKDNQDRSLVVNRLVDLTMENIITQLDEIKEVDEGGAIFDQFARDFIDQLFEEVFQRPRAGEERARSYVMRRHSTFVGGQEPQQFDTDKSQTGEEEVSRRHSINSIESLLNRRRVNFQKLDRIDPEDSVVVESITPNRLVMSNRSFKKPSIILTEAESSHDIVTSSSKAKSNPELNLSPSTPTTPISVVTNNIEFKQYTKLTLKSLPSSPKSTQLQPPSSTSSATSRKKSKRVSISSSASLSIDSPSELNDQEASLLDEFSASLVDNLVNDSFEQFRLLYTE